MDTSFADHADISQSRSNSNNRSASTAAHELQAHSQPVRQELDNGVAQSPNFNTSSFATTQIRNPAFTLIPREQGVLGYVPSSSNSSFKVTSTATERSFPVPTVAGPSTAVPPLDPQDVVRSVKMMSKRDIVHPMDMRIMFGEDEKYEAARASLESLKSSTDGRKSDESVQQLEERLRQLESIIRSKDRIDIDNLRDSLKDEVLTGQNGNRAGKAY
jgi:hypothetical protein